MANVGQSVDLGENISQSKTDIKYAVLESLSNESENIFVAIFFKHFATHSYIAQRRYIQRVHSGVQSVPKCQPTSGLAAMLKATKTSETMLECRNTKETH